MVTDIYHNTLYKTKQLVNTKYNLDLSLSDIERIIASQFKYVRSEIKKGVKGDSNVFTTEVWLQGLGSFVFNRRQNDKINSILRPNKIENEPIN